MEVMGKEGKLQEKEVQRLHELLFAKVLFSLPKKAVRSGGKWWFLKYFWEFSTRLGEMIQFDYIIFFKWVAQPPPTGGKRSFLFKRHSFRLMLPGEGLTDGPMVVRCNMDGHLKFFHQLRTWKDSKNK